MTGESSPHNAMKSIMNDKIGELFQKNLNERLEKIEEKFDDKIVDEIKEILNSQAMLDEITVKYCSNNESQE